MVRWGLVLDVLCETSLESLLGLLHPLLHMEGSILFGLLDLCLGIEAAIGSASSSWASLASFSGVLELLHGGLHIGLSVARTSLALCCPWSLSELGWL